MDTPVRIHVYGVQAKRPRGHEEGRTMDNAHSRNPRGPIGEMQQRSEKGCPFFCGRIFT